MIDGAGRRFDAEGSRTTIEAIAALLGRQWRVAVCLIVVALVLEMLSFGVLYVDATGARAMRASIASVSLLVPVDPQASHAEVDALGPLIRATPGVGETIFRSKEDAIKALIAKGLPSPDGRNPLPDVWIVRLDPSTYSGGDSRTVATTVAQVRVAVGSLPKVDAVTTDEAWLAKVDGLSTWWTRAWPIAFGSALALWCLSLACAALLAGQALLHGSDLQPPTMRVLALFGSVAAIVSLGLSLLATWALVERLNVGSVGGLQSTWSQFIELEGGPLTAVALSTVLILAGATSLGGRRDK